MNFDLKWPSNAQDKGFFAFQTIPDRGLQSANTRVGVAWSGADSLTVFSTPSSFTNKLVAANVTSLLHMVRPQITLFNPIIRKLVNEANGTFLSLQRLSEKPSYGDSRPELLKISRQYRAIMRACLENLHETINNSVDKEEKDLLSSYVNIFYCAECIWHTCEILYIDNIPGDIIMPQLLEWVRIHFPNHEQAASQILEECEVGAEENADYWNTVTGMIMQGRIDIARALLRLHTNCDTNQYIIADNVLRSMPSHDVCVFF